MRRLRAHQPTFPGPPLAAVLLAVDTLPLVFVRVSCGFGSDWMINRMGGVQHELPLVPVARFGDAGGIRAAAARDRRDHVRGGRIAVVPGVRGTPEALGVRLPDGRVHRLRPRRACCHSCLTTHVLLPPCCLLRREDSVHTVAAALLAHIAGHGHRPIAERLHRPASTVRGWLRRATALAAFWRRHGVICAYRLGTDAGPFQPRTTALAEALDTLGEAARVAQEQHASWPPPTRGAPSPCSPAAGSSRPHE